MVYLTLRAQRVPPEYGHFSAGGVERAAGPPSVVAGLAHPDVGLEDRPPGEPPR